jgi:predicted enzyme related to lactoylglutathione lyase
MAENNVVGWFEIPVKDMERAIGFYEAVFGFKMERHQMGPLDMAWFPSFMEGKGAAGSLVKNENYRPSMDGTLVYITSPSGEVENELKKVAKAGGKVLMPKRQISPEYGWMGLFMDTEGNRVAVHSRQG